MSPISFEVATIFLLTIINGLFAMSEVALLSARKVRLQHLADRGDMRAVAALRLLQNPNNFLSTVQIGVTLVGVLSGAFGGATIAESIARYLSLYPVLAPYGEIIGVCIVVMGITYLSLILGELVPKRLALHDPERIAIAVTPPMSVISRIAAPLVAALGASTNAVLTIFRLKGTNEPPITEEDVRGLLRQGAQAGVFHAMEQQIVERVFQFADRRVSTIMTPRADVVWLDVNDGYPTWRNRVLRSAHSRFPMCEGDLDDVLGMVVAKDLLAATPESDIRALLKQPIIVPEQTTALNVVDQLRQAKVHTALVVDEFGGVLGLLTATDLLEALVGDLPAGAGEEQRVVERADGSWLVDGSLPIQELKELLKVSELPGEKTARFETIAGFLIDNLGKIPSEGDDFAWEGNHFEVVDMDGHRIDKVLVVPRRNALQGNVA